MIKKITFPTAYRKFPAGFSIELRPGVNLLVGDQGCGKSSVLDALDGNSRAGSLVEMDDGTKLKYYDFEKYNPRVSTAFGGVVDQGVQVNALFMSHGQAGVMILADLCKRLPVPHTLLIDEPDTGMSIRSCRAIARFFKMVAAQGHQLIVAVHNPILFLSFAEVYSVEHQRWMKSSDFYQTQLEDPK